MRKSVFRPAVTAVLGPRATVGPFGRESGRSAEDMGDHGGVISGEWAKPFGVWREEESRWSTY